ncbi:MAG: enoyl-CoA hydratase/isomerase family protein [Chromatiales bacterium]|jgi:enoyl-CoA hydratase|nr:enoyl-CoA hydratase/isomerase family protein [Chromatiales bacterium]
MIEILQTTPTLMLVINRPARKNAFDAATVKMLLDALRSAEADSSVRCVVIKGANGVFSAGRDLKEAATLDSELAHQHHDRWSEIFEVLNRLRCPSVAVVTGYAVAGGFTLAMGCDFVLATRSAQFGALEMQNGFPAAVCTPLLANKAPPRIGLELAMFGELVGAERLYNAGLINRLAEDDDDLTAVEAAFVGRIEALDALAVRQTIETFRTSRALPISEAMTVGRHLNQLLDATGKFAGGR